MMTKKGLKWMLAIVLMPVVIFLCLLLLLYIPPVQHWAIKRAVGYISRSTGMQASLKQVSLSFPLDLQIDSLLLTRANDSIIGRTDTVANVQRMVAKVQLLPLLDGKVEVDELTFSKIKANTTSLIGDLRIRGCLDRLHLVSHNIDLKGDSLKVNQADLRGGWVDVALGDTVPEDTTKKKSLWRIKLDRLNLDNTHFALHMPGDSMRIAAYFGKAVARQANIMLHENTYKVGALDWSNGALSYNTPYQKVQKAGFDASNIYLKNLNIGIDSLVYVGQELRLNVRAANFNEHSGLVVKELSGGFVYDGHNVKLANLHLKMPSSLLDGHLAMALNAFDDRSPGKLYTTLQGYVSKADLKPFLLAMPKAMYNALPSGRLSVSGTLEGNMLNASFRHLRMALPDHFDLITTGKVANIVGKRPFYSSFTLKGKAQNIDFIHALLPRSVAQTIRLPHGIGIDGRFNISKNIYATNALMTQGGGEVRANLSYDMRTNHYKGSIKASRFPLQMFLPTMRLSYFSGTLTASGKGIDVMSASSNLDLSLKIDHFRYDRYVLDGFSGNIKKQGERLLASINSSNKMIGGRFSYRGRFTPKLLDGQIKGYLSRIDLYALGAMKEHYVVSGWTDAKVSTDMQQRHYFSGLLRGFKLTEQHRRGRQVLLSGNVQATADVQGSYMGAKVKGKVTDINLKALHLIEDPYHISGDVDLSYTQDKDNRYEVEGSMQQFDLTEHRVDTIMSLLQTNMNISVSSSGDNLMMKGLLGNVIISDASKRYTPGDVIVDVESGEQQFSAKIDGGDLHLNTSLEASLTQIGKHFATISTTIKKQLEDKRIDQAAILELLPHGHLQLKVGTNNPFSELLAKRGYQMAHADINVMTSPVRGIDGTIVVDTLLYNDLRIDKLNAELKSSNGKIGYEAWIENSATNSYPYTAMLKGTLYEQGLQANTAVIDKKGRVGIDLGLQLAMAENGLRFNITSKDAIVGYKTFNVNEENYIYLGNDDKLSARLNLVAKDGTGLQLYTDDEDTESLQNLTLSVHKMELRDILKLLPLMPEMSGVVNGDYHIVQTPTEVSVSSDMTVSNFVYGNNRMGNLGLQMVYMPKGENSHYVDATISKDDVEIGTLNGTYDSSGDGHLDAILSMDKFPLSYANGFVPDGIVGLRGEGSGELLVKGSLDKLDINGEISPEKAYLMSDPYGIELRFGDQPLVVENSKITFDDFKLYAKNNSELVINGMFDFSSTSNMRLNMMLRTQNFLLINAKESPRSEAYGKAYVDFMGRVQGVVDNLNLTGMLKVLGSTNMTYIVKDQTLMSDTQLQDLVTFTNFKDTTQQVIRRPDLKGFSMNLNLNIDEQARIKAILNASHTNYIDMIGGGSLSLNYNPATGAQVRGRYTLNSGEMKYTMEVIPLRTFNIQPGSYVNFSGDPMQPTLNIAATERVRANVSSGAGSGRLVDFDCGVKLTKQFPKPSIEFIIDAPEDQEMANTLKTKSIEERSKLAVTMLASGLYFDGENVSSANTAMSGALASFLQTQVNTITGRALGSMGLDLSANMETAADINGALHTDYTFKFAKRLWNNRLRIILGGRVSTGSTMSRENGAYFDNFSLEYRLNKNETKYLKLYYEREAYDWLEGDLSEYGFGFLWRRKLSSFKDIFRFKKDTIAMPRPVKRDSLVNFVK